MINPLAIKTLFEYHYGMYDPIWDIVEGLSREQFVEETDYSLGSVRNQLLHVMEVDNRWLARLQSLPLPALLDENDYPDQATSRLAWDLVRKNVLQYTMALRPDELEEVVELSFPARVANVIIHVGRSCSTWSTMAPTIVPKS